MNNATVETDNPDLRDRAYIYWRLLSTDPEVCVTLISYSFLVISQSRMDTFRIGYLSNKNFSSVEVSLEIYFAELIFSLH